MKWIKYGLYACALGLMIVLMLRPDREPPRGELRACDWGSFAADVPVGSNLQSDVDGLLCHMRRDGLSVSLRSYAAPRDQIVNVGKLRERYSAATGAPVAPDLYGSWEAVLSAPLLVFGNRVPVVIHTADDRRRGYVVAEISDKLVIAGLWTSSEPVRPGKIADLFNIRMNTGGANKLAVLFWKSAQLLLILMWIVVPSIAVVANRGIFKAADQWWDIRTPLGLGLYGGLLPALLLLWIGGLYRFAGPSSGFFLAATLTLVALAQIFINLLGDRRSRRPLVLPERPSQAPVFQTLTVHENKLDILGADVTTGKYARAEVWVPKFIDCPHCCLAYLVYVPGEAQQPYHGVVGPSASISEEDRRKLYLEAVQAAPQVVTNPCVSCGKPQDLKRPGGLVKRKTFIKTDWKFLLLTAVTFPLAILLMLRGGIVVNAAEAVPFVGGLISYLVDEAAGLVLFFLFVPILLLGWHLLASLSDANINGRSGFRRINACEKEGIIFEDIHAARETDCPSCKGELQPLRAFRVTRPSPSQA